MFTKKLVEQDVEVTKVEKRVIEVYHYEGKDYHSTDALQTEIAESMADIYGKLLRFSTDTCHLVPDTKVDTLKNNLSWKAERLFGSDQFFTYLEEMNELKSIYSQLED